MSSATLPIESRLTPQQSLLTDEIGNEVYASHYAERKMSRFVIGTETILLLAAFGLIFSLAHRPIANRYIRIDEMGRAQAIAYTDLNYSPREGEVRTYLTDWANYRYTISRDTIAKKYPLNYYFLSQNLASQFMGEDNQNHLVSQVVGGQIEQSDVEVKNVTITSMSEETVQGATIARGTALVTIDKLYSQRNSREPRTEHWLLSVTYYLNPKQVSDQSRIFPQFETVNPLGLTITEFHENRMSVELPRCPSSNVAVFSRSDSIREVSTACSCGLRSKALAFDGSSVRHQWRSMRRNPAVLSRWLSRSLANVSVTSFAYCFCRGRSNPDMTRVYW